MHQSGAKISLADFLSAKEQRAYIVTVYLHDSVIRYRVVLSLTGKAS
jgi:hypothetical protein